MKLIRSALGAMLAIAALSTAQAAPTIGLSTAGNGVYDTYADLWTNVTDTAVATGFVPGALVGPGAGAPYCGGVTVLTPGPEGTNGTEPQ